MPSLRKLLPIARFNVTTPLPNAEVIRRLTDAIESRHGKKPKNQTSTIKNFTGSISGYKFSITPIINYRNSFLPKITGQIIPFPGGTEIKARLRLHPFVLVFMSFWLGVVGLLCLTMIIAGIANIGTLFTSRVSFNTNCFIALIPFGMFAFGYGLIMFAFRSETTKARDLIAEIVEAKTT